MTNMSILDNRPALKAEIDKVAEVAGYLWQKGWAERNGGNITINITEWVDDAMRALPAIGPSVPIGTKPIFQTLPATMLVTFGGFLTNAAYCFFQNNKNKTWGDYGKKALWGNNLIFCCLAGLLWYSQFFGLSLGKGFLTDFPVLITFSWCILMALNVVFSNVWGILLKEWKGVSRKTVTVLLVGLAVLIFSTFLPQLI